MGNDIGKKIYLLYNPKSGRETIKNDLSDIIETFVIECIPQAYSLLY